MILFIPDKTTTAGSNFRIEVGNGLEGTITDSRSRAISLAMRENLRAKSYDAAYMAGWGVAAALVRTDFASHGDAGRAAAVAAAAVRPVRPVQATQLESSTINPVIPAIFLVVIVGLVILLITSRRRAVGVPVMVLPTHDPDDDDYEQRRRNTWFSANSGTDVSSGGDSGGSSGSDGGSFGDGGGFSGGGSSDTI